MNDVKVVIELLKATPRLGFGYPLIFAGKQTKAVEYAEVSSLEELVEAGFAAETAVYEAAKLLFAQNNCPGTIAVCASPETTVAALPTILSEGWRQLIVVSTGETGESTVGEVAAYIESCGKDAMYFARVDLTNYADDVGSAAQYDRTVFIAYSGTDVANPEAALVGATAGLDVGSFTYKNITLKGVSAQSVKATTLKDMHEAGVITYLLKAGSVVTSEGLVASGEFADIVDCKDYIIQQIEWQCQRLLNRVPKLPYDNRGIAALEGVVLSVLKDAANNGMIAVNDDGEYEYSVSFAPRSQCTDTDISTRQYNEGQFQFTLAGAIHTANIKGTIIA